MENLSECSRAVEIKQHATTLGIAKNLSQGAFTSDISPKVLYFLFFFTMDKLLKSVITKKLPLLKLRNTVVDDQLAIYQVSPECKIKNVSPARNQANI